MKLQAPPMPEVKPSVPLVAAPRGTPLAAAIRTVCRAALFRATLFNAVLFSAALLPGCSDGSNIGTNRSANTDGTSVLSVQGLAPNLAWDRLGPERLGGAGAVFQLGQEYIARYFRLFPSRATAAGFYQHDAELESFSEDRLADWFGFAEDTLGQLESAVAQDCGRGDELACISARVDAELLQREIELHLLDWHERKRAQHDPTLWSGVVGSSTVYLLVRQDRTAGERFGLVAERLRQVPRFLEQAQSMLASGAANEMTQLHCKMAARQAASLADFYRYGLVGAVGSELELNAKEAASVQEAGSVAAAALEKFAVFAETLESEASGSSILGAELYKRRFALYTGLSTSPEEVLVRAEEALEEHLEAADRHALKLWASLFEGAPPESRKDRIRTLFLRLGDDRADSIETFVTDYRTLVSGAEAFVRKHDVVSLPDPLTLVTDRSPDYFSGASVGGVYSAGPYAPEASTLLFLPTPPSTFRADQISSFFRDFNHHFNVMITPHELMPGHYLQLKWAAFHPSKIRALFGDPVTVEGWGTFAERLMLDLGWGDELAFAAHLKKRLENTARTIVDIRVHTMGMTQDEVERFVVDEALQEQQFAANMRRRTLTTSPQLVTYFLGSQEIERAYRVFQKDYPDAGVRTFTDTVMVMGPVPLHWWAELF